jgi:elongation factor G
MVCQQVRDMLKSNAVAITLPIGEEDFKGIVDLVKKSYCVMIRKKAILML